MVDTSVSAPAHSHRWIALGVLLIGGFLAPLDFFIVNVAMPAISQGLGALPADTQLIISGYAVTFAVFLITGGRLGDLFGRKRVFLAGLAGFALASALCGLAWSPRVLIISRLLQAMAAAGMAPQPLASIHALFPPGERARALGIYSVTAGFASVVGQLLGGALVSADLFGLGWRLVFLINLPICLAAFIAAIPLVPDTRGTQRPRLDMVGVVLSAGALAAFVVPLIEGRELDWPWWCFTLLAVSPLFADAFRRWELHLTRIDGDPLVAMDIFAAPGLIRGLGALGAMYAMTAFFLTYAIYLQTGLGRTPLQAGLDILPLSAGLIISSLCSPAIARRIGSAAPSLAFLISASGLFLAAQVIRMSPVGTSPSFLFLGPTLALIGVGMGLAIPMLIRVAIDRVSPDRAGLMGGLVNTVMQICAALAVAVLGGLFFFVRGPVAGPTVISHAFTVTLIGIGCMHLIGASLAVGLGQPRALRTAILAPTAACLPGHPTRHISETGDFK
jgi:MFS family permease